MMKLLTRLKNLGGRTLNGLLAFGRMIQAFRDGLHRTPKEPTAFHRYWAEFNQIFRLK